MARMTNDEFSKKDKLFQFSCKLAKVEPTRRQASKFRMKKGKAFPLRGKASVMYADFQIAQLSKELAKE